MHARTSRAARPAAGVRTLQPLVGVQHSLDERRTRIEADEGCTHGRHQLILAPGSEVSVGEVLDDPAPQPCFQIGLGREVPIDRPLLDVRRLRHGAVREIGPGLHHRGARLQYPCSRRRRLRLAKW